MTAETTIREESSSSRPCLRVKESILKKWKLGRAMKREYEAEKRRYRNKLREKMTDTAFEPETFGEPIRVEETPDFLLMSAVVSIALFNGDVLVYACSGTAVTHWHGNIQDFHTIFVTSARLARKFNDNRTRDDNLRIEVRTYDNRTLVGSLGLYDENNGIAIVMSFSLQCVYTMDTSYPVDLARETPHIYGAFGCPTNANGNLMRSCCSDPVSMNDKCVLSVNCKIPESGHGGPVMYFARKGSLRIAGITVESCEGKITLLQTKKLHDWLQRVLLIPRYSTRFNCSKTGHFCGYSLPEGVEIVIPSGFMVESMILESLGYPLPPPLFFELNGRLAGDFEEHFGQIHYWHGYPFDVPHYYGDKPIWDQIGVSATRQISRSVVSIASFKDRKRCFACTGLLIKFRNSLCVLTSASLVRTGDVEGEIDEKLTIEVFLPVNHTVKGILILYHPGYNIALVGLKHLIPGICQYDIWNEWLPTKFGRYRRRKSYTGRAVVAIGRATKRSHGLMMASMGEVKGKYKECENKKSTGLAKKLNCKELLLSTCQIKKVGIGGPLLGLDDGIFIGMNFYDETGTTPFLPREVILTVLHRASCVPSFTFVRRAVNMEEDDFLHHGIPKRKCKWPVSKPYWFLPGQVHPLDQLVGKVLM